uniref:GG16717 n=1 Tax=Drosophila erecta TaxID=7220 RepID=B3P848_DROER
MAHLDILPAMLGISVLEIPCYTSVSYPKNGFRYGATATTCTMGVAR